jgi:hypothetical protein
LHQLDGHRRQPTIFTARPAVLDGDSLAIDKSSLVQAALKSANDVLEGFGRCGVKESDHRQR